MILGLKDIHKAYGIDVIIDKITFNLEEGEKAAIVGVNGAGKTTLFKIISKQISLDSGEIFMPKNTSIGYFEQNPVIDSKKTIYDEMLSVFDKLIAMEQKLRIMESEMSLFSGDELVRHMEQYSKISAEFEAAEGYSLKSRINGVIKGLGFNDEEKNQSIQKLSGGQKTRVYLGKLLLTRPDLLLLDEPTNHLDIESIQWLEDFLRSYTGAVLIISHDRYFMDRIITKTIEIENKKSSIYEGNYTFYAKQKELNRNILIKQYQDQQKEIKHQQEVIKTLRSFNREKSIKRAESREKTLEKMDKLEKPENLPSKMRLRLEPKITSGNDVLYGENLSKSYDNVKIFENINFDIKRGEKVAIIGPNGVGKTTLFKIIMNEIQPDTGFIRLGMNVKIGYYDQEQNNLNENKTIFEEISDTYPNMTSGEIRNVLAAFVFTGDDIYKTISSLSGGEKGRLALSKIMLSNANFLILDEPTNHLDMYSKEILENAINNYTGTVIYISHDRYFINRTAERTLEITPSGINQYLGNYTYYMEKKNQTQREIELLKLENPQSNLKNIPEKESKSEWLEKKEEQAKIRKQKNLIDKIEKEIENTETKIKELETLLFDDEINKDTEKLNNIFEEKTKLENELEVLYEKWSTVQ